MSNRNLVRTLACSAAVCTAVASAAFAQMDDAKPMAGDKPMAMNGGDKMQGDMQMAAALMKIKSMPEMAGDKLFVLSAAGGNMFESEFSKLVASKVTDAKVKELAEMVGKDHMMANETLMPIAKKMGLDLPTALPSEKALKLEVLGAMPPEELGKAYLMMQRAIHAHDVTMFADHASMAKDSDLKAFINETLPKLKEHGAHINMVAKDMGAAEPGTPADSIKM